MSFERAVEWLMSPDIEGAYSDDPDDSGGPTMYGISKKAHPDVDVDNLTREQAKAIYYSEYWLEAHCDECPYGVDLVLFDAAVQHGVGTAVRQLQRAIGVTPDGVWGPRTRAAVRTNAKRTVINILTERLNLYRKLLNWHKFGGGWSRRMVLLALEAGRSV